VRAGMRKYRLRPLRSTSRKSVAPEPLRAQFEKDVGWREPTHLRAVVAILIPEKAAIGQRRIRKRPVVRMEIVEIGDPGKEPPGSERQPVSKAGRFDIALLDVRRALAVQGYGQPTQEEGVDIGGYVEFGFAQRKSARQSAGFVGQQEARDTGELRTAV